MDFLFERIACLNRDKSLEINLETIAEIYGEGLLDQLAERIEDVVGNIEYLVELGFGEDVSDICNRFGILLCEDNSYFCEKVGRLVTSIGTDYVEKMSEDMSCWETLM